MRFHEEKLKVLSFVFVAEFSDSSIDPRKISCSWFLAQTLDSTVLQKKPT